MRLLVVAISAFSLSACLPVYMPERVSAPLPQDQVALDSREKIKVGDTVTIYTKRKKTEQFEVTDLEPDGFLGIAWDKNKYRVKYANVDKIWVTRWGWHLMPLNGSLR